MTNETLKVLRETIPVKSTSVSGPWGTGTGFQNLVNILGIKSRTDKPLSLSEALQIPAFVLCNDVIAQDVAKARLYMRRRLPNGGFEEETKHDFAKLLAYRPNEDQTWFEFKEMINLHLGAVQNAFIYKRESLTGQLLELIPIVGGVTIHIDEDGNRWYSVSPSNVFERNRLPNYLNLPARSVIHLKSRGYDSLYGYSNLMAGSPPMNVIRALQSFQSRLYKNDAQIKGVFQTDKAFDSDRALARLRDQLRDATEAWYGENRPLVLEDGLKFEPVSQKANEAELSKVWNNQLHEMCRLMRVPPHKVMLFDSIKYENMEAAENVYFSDTILPRVKNIEERLKLACLSREEATQFDIQHDRDELQVRDLKTMSEILEKQVRWGLITLNEARARRGLNPLPDNEGDVRIMPLNYGFWRDGEFQTAEGLTGIPAEDGSNGGDQKDAGLRLVK